MAESVAWVVRSRSFNDFPFDYWVCTVFIFEVPDVFGERSTVLILYVAKARCVIIIPIFEGILGGTEINPFLVIPVENCGFVD